MDVTDEDRRRLQSLESGQLEAPDQHTQYLVARLLELTKLQKELAGSYEELQRQLQMTQQAQLRLEGAMSFYREDLLTLTKPKPELQDTHEEPQCLCD